MHTRKILLLAVILIPAAAVAQPVPAPAAEVLQAVEAALQAADPAAAADDVWRACVERHGTIDPLLQWMPRQAEDATDDPAKVSLLRLHAILCRRVGALRQARSSLAKIPDGQASIADALSMAEVQDALGDNNAALASYEALLKRELDAALRNRIILRTALMRPGRSALKTAAADWEPELRNQAAIVLALQNRQKDAIALFQVSGEGTKRFQQEVRLAEWAIEARSYEDAQKFAWAAVESSKMRRDRRYALAVLVEAYRRARDLDGLIDHFAKATKLDDDARLIWIDLLRETGKVDEALRLFKESTDGTTFTNDMRRQLLELCRETGREKTLVAAYEKLILDQPRMIEWREGLARFYLERGDRDAAVNTWKSHLQLVQKTRPRMGAAASLMKLGLDDLAQQTAKSCVGRDDAATNVAQLFLFELHHSRGRSEDARHALQQIERVSTPDAAVRLDVADAYERMGDTTAAVRVLQGLKDARGERSGIDADIKLAILYSEIKQEEKAQELWFELWRRVQSIPRRKFVEERVMTVASRLGTLARIAVDLEVRLAEGKASDREAGMLISLYTRVNDAVSATEIVEEHLKKKGKDSIEVLTEKARLYHSCNDYFNYEKTVRKLVEVDEHGRPDHLRELAMSLLEKGERREARLVLEQLKQVEGASTTSDEFEAGVLSLAGMHVEAMHAYYRSLARHPERIDTYLLLANTLLQLGARDRAQGMFQSLAASPVKDDLFTIAVDGVLNLQGPRRRPAPSPLLSWTRRMALERVAMRPSKLYLYQLVADLSDEHGDPGMAKRAMKAALPIAGEQRTPLLRELMERTRTNSNGQRLGGIVNVAGRSASKPTTEHLMFGRRLLGQGELVPPNVYLDLGAAFLAGGEVINASRTFNAASRLPEFDELQRKIAGAFETAGYAKEALRTYERVLTVESRDISLLAKVGELHERMGRDDLARELFERGLFVLLTQRPFNQTTEGPVGAPTTLLFPYSLSGSRSTDEGAMVYPRLLSGLLATLQDSDMCGAVLDRMDRDIDAELARIASDAPKDPRLGRYPRLALRTALYRRLAASFSQIKRADAVDARLLAAMPADEKLLDEVLGFRITWGFRASAQKLLADSKASAAARRRHGLRLATVDPGQISGLISVARAAPLVLPLLASGDDAQLTRLVERIDFSNARREDLEQLPVLVNASLCLGDDELCLNLMRFWADTAFSQIRDAAQLNIAFTKLMTQSQEIRILSARQRQSLMGRIVDRIADDPDRFSTLIRRLYTFMTPGDGLIETKQIERLIRTGLSSADRLAYGIPELFGFVPEADRESLLRSVFPLLAPSQKGYFIANYVRMYDISESNQMRAFCLAAFKQGLRDADNPLVVTSAAQRLIRELRPKNIDLIFDILDIVEKRQPDQKIAFSTIARSVQNNGIAQQSEASWNAFVAIWNKYANRKDADRRSLERMIQPFGPNRYEDLKTLVSGLADESKRKSLLRTVERYKPRVTRPTATLDDLRKAVESDPTDVGALSKLERALSQHGFWIEAVDVQQRIVKESPNASTKAALSSKWAFLRHPIKALEADPTAPERARNKRDKDRRGGSSRIDRGSRSSTTIFGGGRNQGTSLPKVTEAQVKKAIRKKDDAEARNLYRGFWRQDANSNIVQHFFNSSTISRPQRPSLPPSGARWRGGLSPAFDARAAFLDWTPPEWKPKPPDRTKLPFLVSKTSFGTDELSRQLRSVEPGRLGEQKTQVVVQALAERLVEQAGKEAIDPILARHASGEASATDYAMLFIALETLEQPEGVSEDLLDAVLTNVGPDARQLRRLAGLYVRFGYPAKASALYRWCACDPGVADPRTGIVRGRRNHADLLGEVLSRLSGEHRAKAVATVLRGSRFPQHDRYGMDRFESETLGMLVALDGAASALAQSRGLINSLFDLGASPRRETAIRAAGLLARSGEHARALELIELATSAHPVPSSARPHERRYWEQIRALTVTDYQWIFAKDSSDWKDAAGWYEAAASRFVKWHQDGKLKGRNALLPLALIAERLRASGRTAASDLVGAAEKLAGEGPEDRLILADVLRAAGRGDDALAIERKLLDSEQLHPERVPAVVASVLGKEGAQAALDLGEKLTDHTLHPDLLDVLVRAANQLGDAPRAARWEKIKAEASIAERKLQGEDADDEAKKAG